MAKHKRKAAAYESLSGGKRIRSERTRRKLEQIEERERSIINSLHNSKERERPDFNEELEFYKELKKKAPRLMDKHHKRLLEVLRKLPQQRDIKQWKPRGKGKNTLLVDLAEHVLAKYKTPRFIWSAMWDNQFYLEDTGLKDVMVRIAAGDSFAKMCKNGEFNVPLTKKQCHEFMQTSNDWSFMRALRRVQIKTYNGSYDLFEVWMRKIGDVIRSKDDEIFWDSALAWFSRIPMLDATQVGPLIDYITHRKEEDENFSLKGRTFQSLSRGMFEWHGELNQQRVWQRDKAYQVKVYERSGFKNFHFHEGKQKKKWEKKQQRVWNITEVLTQTALKEEGRVHGHCVFSYARSIVSRRVSIWSLTVNGNPQITIEVRNSDKSIVQARGLRNRVTTRDEDRIIKLWAEENGLEVRGNSW